MNIAKDDEEEFNKTKSIIDVLKPWLNNNLYWQEVESKNKIKGTSKSFEDELLQHGASMEEVKALAQQNNVVDADPIEQEIEREINGRG